jgi:leucyl/phenylalanyl-tRNA--protein transferase
MPHTTKADIDLLLHAYRNGFFPMAKSREDSQFYWVTPQQRGVIPLDRFHLPRRLAKSLKQANFSYSRNRAFAEVLTACAAPRHKHPDSWINPQIQELYLELHRQGYAHSLEVWQEGAGVTPQLVGGLYGVALGAAFFGESMFSHVTNASKAGLVELVRHLQTRQFRLLDAQFYTPHLAQFGAVEIPQDLYLEQLAEALLWQASFA